MFLSLTELIGTKSFNGKHVYYIGAYPPHDHPYFAATDEEIEGPWFAELRQIFPNFDERQVSEAHLFRFKNAQHIIELDYEAKIPACETPLTGMYLANFTQIYPEDRGTNYAIRDGRHVADLVEGYLTVSEKSAAVPSPSLPHRAARIRAPTLNSARSSRYSPTSNLPS